MAGEHLSTIPREQEGTEDPKLKYGPGPQTEQAVHDRLEIIAAFAYLGKRALMDGGYTPEGWEIYLKEIDCPLDSERLMEKAFEGLLQLACAAWQMLFNPKDSIQGKVIDRAKAEPTGGE